MSTLQRGSSKSGPRLDDERKKEVEGQVRSGHPTRAEEWHDPEPPVDPPPYEDEIGGGRRSRGAGAKRRSRGSDGPDADARRSGMPREEL